MGDLLGWDSGQRAAETERYLELVEADTSALKELAEIPSVERETAG
jgi:hypothetical protein